jgi:hypothetical protein
MIIIISPLCKIIIIIFSSRVSRTKGSRFLLPPPQFKMQFIVDLPEMTLGDAGSGTSFAADVFTGRPAFSELQSFEPCMAACRAEIVLMLGRSNNRLASLDLIVDDLGLHLIAVFTRPMILGNAKSALLHLLRGCAPEHRANMKSTLRPFDDLDRLRVLAMRTTADLRPWDVVEPEVPSLQEPKPPQSREEFYKTWVEEPEPPYVLEGVLLSLEDTGFEPPHRRNDASQVTKVRARWITSVQESAAVCILSIGSSSLLYCRCVYEDRRGELLKWGLPKLSLLSGVVQRCVDLVAEGLLPAPDTTQKKAILLRRCTEVFNELSPGLEITAIEHRRVAVLLGSAPSCDLCTSLQATVSFEWDDRYGAWTSHGVSRPSFQPSCLPAPPLPETRSLCKACARKTYRTCQECRRSDQLYMINRCECGGRAVPRLPRAVAFSPEAWRRQQQFLFMGDSKFDTGRPGSTEEEIAMEEALADAP